MAWASIRSIFDKTTGCLCRIHFFAQLFLARHVREALNAFNGSRCSLRYAEILHLPYVVAVLRDSAVRGKPSAVCHTVELSHHPIMRVKYRLLLLDRSCNHCLLRQLRTVWGDISSCSRRLNRSSEAILFRHWREWSMQLQHLVMMSMWL